VSAIAITTRDPAVIAARAHAVLDSVSRVHGDWPASGRRFLGESALNLEESLGAYDLAVREGGDTRAAAETASIDMGILLLSVAVSLGKATANRMAKAAAEVAR